MDERLRFITSVSDSDNSFAAPCVREQLEIHCIMNYKKIERCEKFGPRGLEERRPVTHTVSHVTPTPAFDELLKIRSRLTSSTRTSPRRSTAVL